jgi:hypothetical protein
MASARMPLAPITALRSVAASRARSVIPPSDVAYTRVPSAPTANAMTFGRSDSRADDAVIAEREDPERHDLFREMRVRPLVRIALREQLERGARVIDLVEVHVARVIEAEAAREQNGQRDEEARRTIATRRRVPDRAPAGRCQPSAAPRRARLAPAWRPSS